MSTRSRGTATFLAISFAGAWGWMLAARFGLGMSLVNPLTQLPFAFMPAAAAVIVRRWVTREGFGDAGLALHLKSAWRCYLGAWLGPLLLTGATCGLAALLGLWRPDFSPLSTLVPGLPGWAFLLLLMAVPVVLTPLYWGEEFGWTGYLRPRVLPGRPTLSMMVTGLIWAVWHYPLAFLGYIEFPHPAVGLAAWTTSMLFQEFLLAWLRTRSRSIWPASLAHAGNNMVLSLLVGLLLGGSGLDALALTLLPIPGMALTVVWLLRSGRRSRPGRLADVAISR
ncbi:CPBP family intramembrane glutamic endopeptidase [Kitasatospora sp. NPDC056138]|uniref:CPBP family intramembrane glutamic endopeptidase n=1 Tax=Kitasatospora sp. NPDC056138 TaxID=3345724 RepID=UPI0035DE3BD3